MTRSRVELTEPGVEELTQAMAAFSEVSESLVASYDALVSRAERVEAELCRTNEELERRLAELDRLKRHLEAVLFAIPTGVVVRDATGEVTSANRAALELLGCEVDELLGRKQHGALLGERAPEQGWTVRELERGPGRSSVLAHRRSSVRNERGERVGSVEVVHDRTEIARMEERIHQQSKMAALGTMAGGIAHEIRNPMNAIAGFASLLAREVPEGKTRRWAERILAGMREVDAIIAAMLSFAEPEGLHPERVSTRELVEDAIARALQGSPRDGEGRSPWAFECEVEDLDVVVDRVMVRQAIRNLLANAMSAQPEGGPIRVRVYSTDDEVVYEVRDEGPGIDPAIARRVTEPFFTTRSEGTGLGLPLVDSIARLHGGSLEFAEVHPPSRGARALIRIPHREVH